MKHLLFSLIFTFVCTSINAQVKITNVYPISKVNYDDKVAYEISETNLPGIETGKEGEVWVKGHDFETEGKKVGTFTIKDVDIIVSEIDVKVSHDSLLNKNLFAVLKLDQVNNEFSSVLNELAAKNIDLADSNNETILDRLAIYNGALANHYLNNQVIEIIQNYGQAYVGSEKDFLIENGLFSGKKFSETMLMTTLKELNMFLSFINNNWKRFFGQRWNLPQFYAYWIANGPHDINVLDTKHTNKGIGLVLVRDYEYSNFPAIAGINLGYWSGTEKEGVMLNSLITRVNGISMFNKSLDEVYQSISDNIGTELTIEFFQDGLFREHICPVLFYNNNLNPNELGEMEFSSPVVYPVINGGFWGIIDGEGNYIVEPKLSKLNHRFGLGLEFSNGLTPFKSLGKWGYMNMLGEIIIEPQFKDKVGQFSGGLSAIINVDNSGYMPEKSLKGFINTSGKMVINLDIYSLDIFVYTYKENRCFFYDDNSKKYGYLDEKGNIAVKPIYDNLIMGTWFQNGKAVVKSNDLKGMIDKTGKVILPIKYKRIKRFSNGYLLVTDESGSKMLDKDYNHLTQFDKYPLGNVNEVWDDHFIIYVDKNPILVDIDGELQLSGEKFDLINDSGDYYLLAADTNMGDEKEWCFINPQGDVSIEGPFDEVGKFNSDVCWVKANGKWGIIDRWGKWLAKPFSAKRPFYFNGELAMIDMGTFTNPMYFYVNKKGHIVYDPRKKFKW